MSAVLRAFRALVLVVVVAVVALGAVFVLGVRAKYPPVVRGFGRFARDVGNPRALQSAGAAGSRNHVIEHRGRTSGKEYRTPITATEIPTGYVIALPYGATTDWVRNVLAAGSATLVINGGQVPVEDPQVVPLADVAGVFGRGERVTLGLFGVSECLQLRAGS